MIRKQPEVYAPSPSVSETADYIAGVLIKRPPTGRVYLVRAKCEPRRLKIGWTRGEPEKRVAEIQGSSPFPLQLLIHIPGDRRHEQMLHAVFREFRVQGEWFEQHADIAWTFKRIQEALERGGL